MSNYPPYYHYRTMYEALSKYETYSDWAAQASKTAMRLREEGDLFGASAFQRISANEYRHASVARNTYVNQKPLAEAERRERDGR